MNLILILSSLITILGCVMKKKPRSNKVKINGKYYRKEILKKDIDRPYLLAVDYCTDDLYFSYSLRDTDDRFRSAKLNLKSKKFSNIKGVSNGFAQTIDQELHDIYIGGSDGIYKYNCTTNRGDYFAERGTNIWNLYFNDILYFTVYPTQFLYMLSDDISKKIPYLANTKVDHFVIDNENVIFFTNDTGLYSRNKTSNRAILYKRNKAVRSLTTDVKGKVYVCFQDGIYGVTKTSVSLQKIIPLDDGFGLAFDSDNNIIYSDATSLVRLNAI